MSANLKVPPEFDALSSEEQITYVQDLWDRIAQQPERVAIPDEHKRIVEERLREYAANPDLGRPWSEVRDELLAKLRG